MSDEFEWHLLSMIRAQKALETIASRDEVWEGSPSGGALFRLHSRRFPPDCTLYLLLNAA
jgi:hypothetical protein